MSKRQTHRRFMPGVCAACAAIAYAGAAYAVEAPAQIPAGIPAGASVFAERDALVAALNTLNAHIDAHNGRCSAVPSDNAGLIAECTQSNARLDAEETQYRSRLEAYLRDLRAAKHAAAVALPQN